MRKWVVSAGLGFAQSCALVGVSMLVPAVWAAAVGLWIWWGGNPWSWIAPFVWAAIGTVLLARPVCRMFRSLVGRWTGTVIPDGYRRLGAVTELSTGFWWNGYSYSRTRRDARQELWWRTRFTDPAGWRDLRFVAIAPAVGLVAAIPFGGIVLAVFVNPVPGVIVTIASSPYAWRIVVPASRFLRPPATERVEELTAQRADTTVAQAAELRRIERDLHDGAQARLVALGMSLATAERLMRTNPDQAVRLLREARAGAAASLTELRDLVRGISPPVLTERGLVDAVRALALDSPLDVTVEADLVLRLEPPVESALYFAIAELLTNAAKHARATHVRISIAQHDGIVIEVTDDGRGGVVEGDSTRTGGLAGLRRRLAVFDGVLDVTSPAGGPTVVRIVVAG
ncbi:sensor histidine kinase [Kutzneria buriramensis]|uniref:histidine kinase n=1 Tax=Kutzneria buriramensis TaxID=1045776 RepID=A0A3E0I6S8_9PSEU|nr:histidine kinase [Kutzneria buriramensis]REH54432.1 signal transduction histidine kinase [Kutzneria buriramensis]